ncbi:trichohyalin-like [Acipenser oxyrinchus oxyrinchus]|uniref:Trichohyalin-like n=1 Tax=Acipenser oxyrinchus oxyrinchus TaxID=40147 RepID=A0AAD8FRZ7_ACIOX|nr:trichohyalin-like [Acipenser oxyrinchus oxyrinchus]
MHAEVFERQATPRRRVFSRCMSEDGVLDYMIKESEGPLSAKREARTQARRAHLKSLENEKQQTEEEELVLKSLEMSDESELQEQYEEALQSVKQLEVQQGVLCFEVDWLRDVLEGMEEQLAEAERQSRDAYLEMQRERQAKQELEGTVRRLLQELERLREENSTSQVTMVEKACGTEDMEGSWTVREERKGRAGRYDERQGTWEDGGGEREENRDEERIQEENYQDLEKYQLPVYKASAGSIQNIPEPHSEVSSENQDGKYSDMGWEREEKDVEHSQQERVVLEDSQGADWESSEKLKEERGREDDKKEEETAGKRELKEGPKEDEQKPGKVETKAGGILLSFFGKLSAKPLDLKTGNPQQLQKEETAILNPEHQVVLESSGNTVTAAATEKGLQAGSQHRSADSGPTQTQILLVNRAGLEGGGGQALGVPSTATGDEVGVAKGGGDGVQVTKEEWSRVSIGSTDLATNSDLNKDLFTVLATDLGKTTAEPDQGIEEAVQEKIADLKATEDKEEDEPAMVKLEKMFHKTLSKFPSFRVSGPPGDETGGKRNSIGKSGISEEEKNNSNEIKENAGETKEGPLKWDAREEMKMKEAGSSSGEDDMQDCLERVDGNLESPFLDALGSPEAADEQTQSLQGQESTQSMNSPPSNLSQSRESLNEKPNSGTQSGNNPEPCNIS